MPLCCSTVVVALMPGTDREDVQLENIRGRPLKIQHHTAQHSPKIVDEAKREGESTESESITEAETETDVEAPKSLPNVQPNAETRSRSRSRIRSAARWATHPYIRASLPEIFVSLQLHIVDRSVGHIGRLRTVIEDRNESAWVSVLKRRETPRGRESKNESVHYRQCLFVRCVQPELGSVPKWTSRASKSAALCPAHHPRKDTRRQGVSLRSIHVEFKIWHIMFLVLFP